MRLLSLIAACLLAGAAIAEEYQCGFVSGCDALINEDGEVKEVKFRKGDIVSPEAGWVVSPEDGWVKLDTRGCRQLLWINAYVGAGLSTTVGVGFAVPRGAGRWARPTAMALVGFPD